MNFARVAVIFWAEISKPIANCLINYITIYLVKTVAGPETQLNGIETVEQNSRQDSFMSVPDLLFSSADKSHCLFYYYTLYNNVLIMYHIAYSTLWDYICPYKLGERKVFS